MTFELAGFTVGLPAVIATVAVLQWLIIIASLAFSKEKMPKKGIRSADRRLLASTAVFVLAWAAAFSIGGSGPKVAAAAVVSGGEKHHGSCSLVSTDMDAAVVKSKLGDPDEIKSDEATRGPGAAIWVYRDSRCAVHILDNKVEFID